MISVTDRQRPGAQIPDPSYRSRSHFQSGVMGSRGNLAIPPPFAIRIITVCVRLCPTCYLGIVQRIESSNQRRSRNAHSFIAVNITAPNNQQHIPGISHHG
jgi:hypothetical protein